MTTQRRTNSFGLRGKRMLSMVVEAIVGHQSNLDQSYFF